MRDGVYNGYKIFLQFLLPVCTGIEEGSQKSIGISSPQKSLMVIAAAQCSAAEQSRPKERTGADTDWVRVTRCH